MTSRHMPASSGVGDVPVAVADDRHRLVPRDRTRRAGGGASLRSCLPESSTPRRRRASWKIRVSRSRRPRFVRLRRRPALSPWLLVALDDDVEGRAGIRLRRCEQLGGNRSVQLLAGDACRRDDHTDDEREERDAAASASSPERATTGLAARALAPQRTRASLACVRRSLVPHVKYAVPFVSAAFETAPRRLSAPQRTPVTGEGASPGAGERPLGSLDRGRAVTLEATMRVQLPLPALSAATRAAGGCRGWRAPAAERRSRASSWSSIRGASRLAARLPLGSARLRDERQDDDGGDGGRDPRPRVRLAHNSSGANLVSGVASTLLAPAGAELGLFEVDEAALPEVARRVRPRAVCLGNLFRDQLDRYGELEHVAERWRALARELPTDATLVVNGDDPQWATSGTSAPSGRLRPRRPAPRATGPPARGRLQVVRPLRDAVRVRGRLRRPPRRLPVPACGHGGPRSTSRLARSSCRARGARSCSARRGEQRRVAARAGPLQRLQRARGGGARARARRVARRGRRRAWSASAPRSGASSASSSATAGC